MEKRKFRTVGAIAIFSVLLSTIFAFRAWEKHFCMGVAVINESELQKYLPCDDLDLSMLAFNDKKVALDVESRTVYISQLSDKLDEKSRLEGIIRCSDPAYQLYFLNNDALKNIKNSVAEGHPLSLVICDGTCYQTVQVIVTTLPVIALDGEVTHLNDEGRAVFTGNFTIWTGSDPETNAYSIKTSDVQWHVRGNSTSGLEKCSWKISLKKENGNNNDLNLLGMGADDDWILNSLVMDDCKVREKLFMDLWNENARNVEYNYKMSSGEYVEILICGEYKGLFLLQRRLDAKYLGLENETILKETQYDATNAQAQYELRKAGCSESEIYAFMEQVYNGTDCSGYNAFNLVDTNLFLQLFMAWDNFGHKNMYHVLRKTDSGFEAYLIPWDTDMTLGLNWGSHGFYYAGISDSVNIRYELGVLEDQGLVSEKASAAQWKELRQGLFSEDNIKQKIESIYDQIALSGSVARDKALWGERYSGVDTVENLKMCVSERLRILDAHYGV